MANRLASRNPLRFRLNGRRPLIWCMTVVLLQPLTGCQAWHTRPVARNAPQVEYRHPVRVSLADGSVVTLTSARIEGDSIVGVVQRGTADTTALVRSFSIGTVISVEEREFSAGRTIGLVFGSVVAVFAVLFAALLVALASWDWQ